jgi:ABC-2 type transport system permease protein
MMSFRRTWAVFRKELLHIRRDPRSLILIILLPIMLLLIYGNALTFDIKHIPLACVTGTRKLQPDLIRDFQGSPYFNLRYPVSGYKEIDPSSPIGRRGWL